MAAVVNLPRFPLFPAANPARWLGPVRTHPLVHSQLLINFTDNMFPCNSINLRLLQLLLPVTAVTVIRVIVRNIMMNIMINSIPPSHNPLRSRKGGKGRTWRKTSLRHRHQNPRPVPQAGCLASLPRLLKVLGVSTTVCLACLACLALPGLFDIRISFLTASFPSLSELLFGAIWWNLMELAVSKKVASCQIPGF